ncbi:MAG: hypothetical protein A3C85_04425 [Candidatus Doudnabacteria bacterium RIFCSPHIGHO2_02_FULL_48_21]|uniref:ABC transmembrane type-2 domain-containing protein n=1 Tax=Candidatus Doudnabacteria bacterium RIFCSPLOWO2_02_FULL_48_13 TaxID=1817845 RepID=A0A1F5QDM4_9BACT|nr:MAG: hypothetical protein A3K05_00640 [Candidatus Doudnabacteria bacterium RIFCSPHIGHO2_01_48_18]OGE79660.1 MAG: hypothetical protein A2668_01010 [Candidatus Doudnabacteria bacterium RIFCSPHIGHO2_01_FULL_48_180]OGE91460.1 MAG: hypothetical protein A3F44_01210 [Candidatus Doudnabacteria bacterium RIFCSPHIGHO2_12_FULL_47_25]OGE93075.1 MAG: hypothetical protein A3C85_04425 [Candidatus Doudnabacteria bacterium RIFCSPHIGHO2_02_FULL_48_21]OGE98082.1 MAG: hypothetical protein A3A83_02390 [Candidatu
MNQLVLTFLRIFFRNRRAIFFVLLLPAGIFLILTFMRVEQILQFDVGLEYTDFLLAGIMAYAIMQMGIYTVSYSLIDYKKQGVLKRLAVSPLSARGFLQAHSLARFAVALIQVAVLLGIGMLLTGSRPSGNVMLLPLVILLGSAVFLNFGYVISAFARDYEEAAPYTTIVGLGLGFLGDVFFSLSNLPALLQNIGEVLPMSALSGAMRYSLFGVQGQHFVFNLIVLCAWFVIGTVVANAIFAKKAYK